MINTPLVKQQIEKYIKNLKYSDFFGMWLEELIQGSVTKNEFFTLISMIFEELEKKNIEEQTGIQIIFTKASNKSPLNGTFGDLKRFKSTEVNIFHNNYVSKFLISLLDNEYITYHYPCLRMKNWNTKGRYEEIYQNLQLCIMLGYFQIRIYFVKTFYKLKPMERELMIKYGWISKLYSR